MAWPSLAAPPTPTGLSATWTYGQATLTWNASAGATSYKVKRSCSYEAWGTVASQSGRTFTDNSVNRGTTYFYKVSAVNSSGESADSAQVSAYPLLSPTTNFIARAGSGQVKLDWDPIDGRSGYSVKCGTSVGNYTLTQSVPYYQNYYTWTGLTPGTTYYFVVQGKAQHANGDSPWSSPVSATPFTTPTGLSAVAGNGQITLDWNDSTGASNYKVKRSTTSGGPYSVVATPATSAYTDTGLTNGTTYYYVVSASGPGGESGNSSQVSDTPQLPTPDPPGAPAVSNIAATSLRVTAPILPANADSITLQKKLTGQSDATYTNVATGLTALAETDVTGLAVQTGYTFRCLAVNAAGSVAGAATDATTLPNAPAAPTALTALAGDGQVALSWQAATGAVSYRVERSAVTGGPYALVTEGITGLSYTDATVTNGTTYFYVVSGVNAGGVGDLSNQASATPLEPAPDAPGAPAVSEITTAQLKATAPALPARADTLTLQKKLASAPDTDYVNVATGLAGGAQTMVTGLAPATAYSFRYVAVGDGGSTPGASTNATTLPNPPPSPQNLAAVAGDGEVGLTWSASTGATTYVVKRATVDGGPYAIVAAGVTTTSYQDAGLTNGTPYCYVVSAVNSGGESGNSNQAAATPQIPAPGAPGVPTFSAITASTLTAHLPVLPARAATLRLQRKLAGESDAAYVTIAEDLAGASTVAVTALASATEYAFRVVAVGAGGSTPGAGASVTTLADPPAAPAAPAISEITANSLRVTAPALPLRATSLTLQKKLATEGDENYSTVAADLAAGAETVVTGLSAQTTYAFRYIAVGAGGSTAGASTSASTLPNAPGAPQNVAAVPGDAQVTLSWDAVTGATGYQVQRSTTDSGPYSVVAANVTATSYVDTTVTNGTTYYYVVVAFNAGGESANSAQVSATPQIAAPDAPDAPTFSAITASTLTAHLPVLPARASSLRLEKKLSGAGNETYVLVSETHPANASLPVTGLLAATSYDFRVVAVGAGGSTPGSGASVTTLPNPPAAPTALQATAGDGEVQLSWAGATGATGYNLKRSLTEGGPYTTISANVAGQTATDTGVTNGTTYYYVVSAINSGGESGLSNEASATPQVSPPSAPGAPLISEITATSLKATAPILPSGAASLTLQKKLVAEPDTAYTNVATGLAALAETVVTGLQPATEYSLRYIAVNAGGSTAGAGTNATTLPNAPVAPLNLTALAGDGQVALSWDAVAGADAYAVKRSTVDGGPYTVITADHALTSFTDTGLTNGTRYYYVVSAINSGGASPNSNQADAMPLPPAPAAPAAPVISGITATSVLATAPALPANASSLTLQKKLSAAGDETYTVVAENLGAAAETPVTGLSPETSYSFRYIATGLAGSTPGAVAEATTLPNAPSAPQNLTAAAGNAQVVLSWDAVTGATSYTLKRATVDGGPYTVVEQGLTQTNYTNTGLTNGTTYYYIVTAVNAGGESASSNQVSATPTNNPPPTALTLNTPTYGPGAMPPPPGGSSNAVQLSWSATLENDIAWYKVYRKAAPGVTQNDTLVASLDPAQPDPFTGVSNAAQDANALPAPAPGATYYYRVFVVDSANQSTGSNEVSITLTDTPPAAVTLSEPVYGDSPMFPGGPKSVQLSWSANTESDLQSYKIYRSTTAGVTEMSTLVGTITRPDQWSPLESQYSDDGALPTVPPGTTYHYRVFAVDAAGQSTGSNEESITLTDAPPTAVVLQTPTYATNPMFPGEGNKTVQLAWSASTENDIQSYKIYRATAPGVTQDSALVATIDPSQPDATSYSDRDAVPTIPPGTRYYYRVFVTDTAGQTTGSNEESILLTDTPPLAVVLNEPAYSDNPIMPGGPKAVQLSWSANTESDIASYKIYRATAAGINGVGDPVATITRAGNNPLETSYSDSAAVPLPPPGVTYYYRIFVVDNAGQTAGSNEESISLTDNPPAAVTLDPPTYGPNPILPGGQNGVNLKWSLSGEPDFKDYRLYRSPAPGVTQDDMLVTTVTQRTPVYGNQWEYSDSPPDTGASNLTYYYRVFVTDNANQSTGSNEVSLLLPPAVPDVPQFENITQTSVDVHMPSRPARALSLMLQSEEGAGNWVTIAETQTDNAVIAVTDLYGSTDYRFRCMAVGLNAGTPGAVGAFRTDEAPPPSPGAPTFSDLTLEGVTVHAPALPPSTSWMRLEIKVDGQSDAEYVTVANQLAGGAVTPVGGLNADTTYVFRYVAVGTGGYTPGASASILISSPEIAWLAGEPINCGGIRWPAPGGNPATIAPGAMGRLSAFLATDWDLRVVGAGGVAIEEKKVSDPCSYTWTATFEDGTPAGSFPNGNSGQSVVWIAPQTADEVTIKLTIDDQNAGNIAVGDVGTRDDATRGYDDTPQTFSVTVDVGEVQQ